MRLLVLGAGRQACAAANFFEQNSFVQEFICCDVSRAALQECKKYLGKKGKAVYFDVENARRLKEMMTEFDGILDTLPFSFYKLTTKAAIRAGKSKVDLGGNNAMIAIQLQMHKQAMESGATIVPACGLAPGLCSDLGFNASRRLASLIGGTESVEMFCGGLPQKPKGELRHSAFFNLDGLYNEYREVPQIILDGRDKRLFEILPEYKSAYFEAVGSLESALTHGGFYPDPALWKNVKKVCYITLRHPGHFAKVRELLKKYPRDKCLKILRESLAPSSVDLVVLRVAAVGFYKRAKAEFIYELIDYADENTGLSAMQRCTAYPAAETLMQVLTTKNWPAGVVYHEQYVDMARMISSLRVHNIKIKSQMTASGQI